MAPHLRGLAHIATAAATGQPHVALVSPVVVDEDIWFLTFRASGKAKNIAADGRVALMWSPAEEAYVGGVAELIDDADRKAWLWNSGLLGYEPASFFHAVDHPAYVAVKVTPQSATVIVHGANGFERKRWTR